MAIISSALKNKLIKLADRYETKDFLKEDPSQFLYYYKKPQDIELCAFIASLLSFGNRKQFIPKIKFIMEEADTSGGIYLWLKDHCFEKSFSPANNEKFYRFYSYKDMYYLFAKLSEILYVEKSLGIFLSNKYNDKLNYNENENKINLIDVIAEIFEDCQIVPSTKTSAKKRLCMFLRWMVRDNSPVDIGLWPWFSKEELLIPLDVHVLEESKKLGLLPEKAGATRKVAEQLSEIAREIFDGDPCRLDFALFGIGVDKSLQ